MLAYPQARIEDATDTLAGVSFPDPYRWMEQDSEDVLRWQRSQAEIAAAHVREWPHFEHLRSLVARFSSAGRQHAGGLPRYAAGRWFRMHMPAGASQAQALVANEPMGDGRVLFDPMTENAQRPPFLSWIAPSPDGRTLALGVCADGSENNTIRLIDVETARVLTDAPQHVLMDALTGGVQWLPDSSGFFFSALAGAAVDFDMRVYLHLRTPKPTTTPLEVEWRAGRDYRMAVISRDGRYVLAMERIRNPIPVAIAELGAEPLRWRPFITSAEHAVAGHLLGERYVAVTYVGAARGRVVAIPIDARNPNDPRCWQELVAESEATLRTITPVGSALYLTEFIDSYARVRVVDLDGQLQGEVPLPGKGAIVSEQPLPMMDLPPRGHPDKFLFAFSSFTVSPGIYSHTPGSTSLEVLSAPAVSLDDAVVEDRLAVSADGTHVPYHVVRRADVGTSTLNPTLIYAYGGFNIPLVPQFPGAMAAFVAAGGVFVHAHLRGGGEFGMQWWRDGQRHNAQNSYNDLYAVAEDLIRARRCAPRSLALTGASHGGLMAGVALTQRPDLWSVVVPQVPVLDLVGSCRRPYGRMCVTMERADVEDPNEVRRLVTFSPYHLVREGVRYPAVFLDAGATDPRCPPWHARKFAARLQHASAGAAPILLQVRQNVGHGLATDHDCAVLQSTEWLAFTCRHLGLGKWYEEAR